MERTPVDVLEPSQPAAPQKGKGQRREKKVRRVVTEEFTTPIIEEPRAAETSSQPQIESEPELSEVDQLLDEIEEQESENYTIRVDRLPSYDRTGQWASKHAETEFCGYIPASIDYLKITQASFGAGMYRFTLYNGRNYVKKWRQKIAELPAQVVNPQNGKGAVNYFISGQPGQSQQTQPVKGLIDQLKETKELLGLVKEIQSSVTPATENAPSVAAPVEKEVSIQDKITDKLIDYALKNALDQKDDTKVDRLLDRVLGPEEAFSWPQLIKEVAAPLIPALAQIAGLLLTRTMQAQQTAGQSGPHVDIDNAGGNSTPPSPATAPQQLPAPQPLDDWTRLLRQIVSLYANGFSVDVAAAALDDFAAKHQDETSAANCTALATEPPAQVAAQILTIVPFRADAGQFTNWIADLQAALNEPGEDQEQ